MRSSLHGPFSSKLSRILVLFTCVFFLARSEFLQVNSNKDLSTFVVPTTELCAPYSSIPSLGIWII